MNTNPKAVMTIGGVLSLPCNQAIEVGDREGGREEGRSIITT